MGKVYLLSLGCPKNLVDSDLLLKRLAAEGMQYTPDPDDSDVILVNTCGFVEEAKKESIEEIVRIAGVKERRSDKKLLVFGCLAKRYGNELKREIPEIDALWGVGDEEKIVQYCKTVSLSAHRHPVSAAVNVTGLSEGGALSVSPGFVNCGEEEDGKFIDTSYSYLKIAEGCDRHCTYCVIPSLRGRYVSRDPELICREAETLVQSGSRELILIAQDITSYGKEMRGYGLSRLLRELASIQGDFWIRLLYLYPDSLRKDLIETIAEEEKVCNYIDMPVQHSDERILRLMGRRGSRSDYEKLIAGIREIIPGVALRTTLIVGFPQETNEIFQDMLEFVRTVRFERLGAFTYSREEGTPAAGLRGHVSKSVKKKRFHDIMELQAGISLKKNEALVGSTFRALVDESEDGIAVARIYSQAPDIDGVVFIEDARVMKGQFVTVTITEAYDYDLKGILSG